MTLTRRELPNHVGAMLVIDAHAHVWTQDHASYPFRPLDGLPAPQDERTPANLDADSASGPADGVLLIQPRVYGYDHTYLYDAATTMSGRGRIMPLIDPTRPDAVATLRQHARSSMAAGFRVVALDQFSADRLWSSAAHLLWATGEELGLPVGVLIGPNQLPLVAQVASSHPQLTIVIDHLARCDSRQLAESTSPLCDLIERPNVYVKVSAIDALSHTCFPHRDMWPLVQAVYTAGGAAKLLWGSDWPHNMVHGAYGNSRAAIEQALAHAPDADLDAIFAATAAQLFGFDINATTAGVTDGDT